MSEPILQTIGGTGTPRGWSYWTNWLDACELKAVLSNQPSGTGLSGQLALDVGSAFHALMELYYKRGQKSAALADRLDTRVIQWVDPQKHPENYREKVLKEAMRLFTAYRLEHTSDDLGRIEAVEEMYTIEDFFGVDVFTIRSDLETVVDQRELQALGVKCDHGGTLIVDHKTYNYPQADDPEYVMRDRRFTAYQEAWKRQFPRKPLAGLIVNCIFKQGARGKGNKEPRVVRLYVPPPGDYERKQLKAILTQAMIRRTQIDMEKPLAVPLHCVKRGGGGTEGWTCKFFGSCEETRL